MTLGRRTFLQAAGLTLAGLGLEAGLEMIGGLARAQRYGQALAQPAGRKLALLVGINGYSSNTCDCIPLQGCLTDLELQRQLLIHRFGFAPRDVVILTEQAATRSGIETAFVDHLINQAQPDDLVLFHFSGYGSTIQLESDQGPIQWSLVPIDSVSPSQQPQIINDLPEETLGLLLHSLKTEKIITVLDTSYSINPTAVLRNTVYLRSRPKPAIGQLSDAALAFQAQLRQNLANPNPEGLPGLVCSGITTNQAAVELNWGGFTSGVFTYCLTQYLWHATNTPSLTLDLQQVKARMLPLLSQVQTPAFQGLSLGKTSFNRLGLLPSSTQGLDGAITAVSPQTSEVNLWLGGIPPAILPTYPANAWVKVPRAGEDTSPLYLQIIRRDRLEATARLGTLTSPNGDPGGGNQGNSQLAVDQGIQEKTRILPTSVNLKVVLDGSLDRIERIDATSAFSSMNRVDVIPQGDQAVDCVLGRLSQVAAESLAALGNPTNPVSGIPPLRYGLFPPGQDVLPGTVSTSDEAVKTAVQRLESQFHSLLALKMLRQLDNSGSSELSVQVDLMDSLEGTLLGQSQTSQPTPPQLAPLPPAPLDQTSEMAFPSLAPNSPLAPNSLSLMPGRQIRCNLKNLGDRPLYALLIITESEGQISIAYPPNLSPGLGQIPSAWPVLPGVVQGLEGLASTHGPVASLEWMLPNLPNPLELMFIFSVAPLERTLATAPGDWADNTQPLNKVTDSLAMVEALRQDLCQASLGVLPGLNQTGGLCLDMSAWAMVRFTYQAIPG